MKRTDVVLFFGIFSLIQVSPSGAQTPGAGAQTQPITQPAAQPSQPGAQPAAQPVVQPGGSAVPSTPAQASGESQNDKEGVRLKDMARIIGMRSNQLLGYGIVVGLPGTGDSRSKLASESIQNLLGTLGQKLESSGSQTRNIAAVLVTAELPPFARRGDKVNVTVSSIGDARSLEGGVLVQTPLVGGNNEVYAVAQGVVTTGGQAAAGSNSTSQRRTVGSVMNGAHIEKEVAANFLDNRRLRVTLLNFDFATLNQALIMIKKTFPTANAVVEEGSITVTVPEGNDPVSFIAILEEIRVVPRYNARVVINERTGTIVMGGDVRVDPVSVSRGGMQIIVTGANRAAASGNTGTSTAQSGSAAAKAQAGESREFSGTSISEIIESLNQMGATVRDIIAILEALKQAGALHAELIVI